MKLKLSALAISALVGTGLMSLSTGTASAAMPLFPQVAGETATNDGIVQVVHRNGKMHRQNGEHRMRQSWNRDRDGRRCNRRNDNCRYFRNGYYYESPWWTLPLIIGGGIVANSLDNERDYGNGNAHVEWCLDHYRSYNPRTNTWVSYSGEVRQCNSPY